MKIGQIAKKRFAGISCQPRKGGDKYKVRSDVAIRLEMLFAAYKDHPKVIVSTFSPKKLQDALAPTFESNTFIGVLGSDTALYLAPNLDTEYLKFLAWKDALAAENIDFTIEEYMPVVGHSSKNILLMISKQKGIEIPQSVIERKESHYGALQKQGVPPIKEMIAFAKGLSESREKLGIKLGLASSAPTEEIMQNLRQIGLENAFDLVISGSDDLDAYVDKDGKNKPKPYIYIEAAKRLNVAPSKCLVFEDTTAGVEAAFFAGMIVIAVPNQFTLQQDFSKATQVIHDHAKLPAFEKVRKQ